MNTIPLGSIKRIIIALKDPSEPRNMRAIAVASWRFLVVLAVLFVGASLFYGFAKFQSTLKALEDARATPPATQVKFNRGAFDAIVAAFNDRQLEYQVIVATPQAIADPSK